MTQFNRFNCKIPFAWDGNLGKIRLQVQAMVGDGDPAPWFTGPGTVATITLPGDFGIVLDALYDQAGARLPGFTVGPFSQGNWEGAFDVRSVTGPAKRGIAVAAGGSWEGAYASGQSNNCDWTPPGAVVPPPPPPPPPPPGGTSHPVTLTFDGKTYTGTLIG